VSGATTCHGYVNRGNALSDVDPRNSLADYGAAINLREELVHREAAMSCG